MARKVQDNKLNHLGKLRINSLLTRVEAAKELRCTLAFLCIVEKKGSQSLPSPEMAKKMCDLYKCTMDEIYDYKKKKTG